MLSDKFIQEDLSSNENLSKQIIRLEELSISMTSLIESGNSHKIVHLEKIRQKILKDIIKNKKPISVADKPKISNNFGILTCHEVEVHEVVYAKLLELQHDRTKV